MNFIFLMLDSFRQDHLGVYNQGRPVFEGVPACRTPNLDAFAQSCVVFDNAYPQGLPTIPVRTELMTGQETLPFRSWQPLLAQDLPVAEILAREGYVCGLVSDCYHYRAPGMNFHRGFHAYRWIRGQEYDPYNSAPPRRNLDDYVNASFPEVWRQRIAQFLANTDDYAREADWFPARVVDEAVSWLRQNRAHDKVFLWIDSFDPHEPWDPPARFDVYGDPGYRGRRLIMPMGGQCSQWATPEEVRHIQGLYAGEAAFVDHCLGQLFAALGELGYLDDSVVVITADHGHPLGDHGKFLKGPDRMYNELLKVPFFVRLPGGENGGRRSDALVQFADVLPTVLDVLGLGGDALAMHGQSFRGVLTGETDEHRDAVIVGFHDGVDRCVRDREWSLAIRPGGEPDELYDLREDPREQRNLIDAHPEQAVRLAGKFGSKFFPGGHPTAAASAIDEVVTARRGSKFFRGSPRTALKGVQGKYEVASGTVE